MCICIHVYVYVVKIHDAVSTQQCQHKLSIGGKTHPTAYVYLLLLFLSHVSRAVECAGMKGNAPRSRFRLPPDIYSVPRVPDAVRAKLFYRKCLVSPPDGSLQSFRRPFVTFFTQPRHYFLINLTLIVLFYLSFIYIYLHASV